MIKKYWLLLIIIILINFIALYACTPTTPIDYLSNDDYLLYKSGGNMENSYLSISKTGFTEFFYYLEEIKSYKSGTLTEKEMKDLTEVIEENRFFDLEDEYHSQFENANEDVYNMISVQREDGEKIVFDYTASEAPDLFYNVLSYIWDIEQEKLQDDPRYGIFIIAKKVDSLSPPVTKYNEDELGEHPYLLAAVNHSWHFIYTGPSDSVIGNILITSKVSGDQKYVVEEYKRIK